MMGEERKPLKTATNEAGTRVVRAITVEHIQSHIRVIRGQRVILDADLAELYDVPTKRLNEQVKRNIGRFPDDFMFQVATDEVACLRSQIATSNAGRGGRRYRPYAFTEHGVIMAASVLNSERAIQTSVFVVRAFVRLRQMLAPYKELADKLDRLEQKVGKHDKEIAVVVDAIRLLMAPEPEPPKQPFGFRRAKKQ